MIYSRRRVAREYQSFGSKIWTAKFAGSPNLGMSIRYSNQRAGTNEATRKLFRAWDCEGVVVESARAREHGHVSDLIYANIFSRPVVVTNDQKLCG